ncbi:unnamed protein product [Rhizophagus irregularis]|nr:unnamed protein product [Rhizophagus irregularis]
MANTSTSARTSSTPQHEHPFRAGSSASPRYSRSFVHLWLISVTSNYLHSSGWASFIRYPTYSRMFPTIISKANESSKQALNAAIANANNLGKKFLSVGFDCSWSNKIK